MGAGGAAFAPEAALAVNTLVWTNGVLALNQGNGGREAFLLSRGTVK